jgi:hypothetical protein
VQGALKIKKATYIPTYFFWRFLEIFRSDFGEYCYGVFELVMQRNGQKRDKKEIEETQGQKKENKSSNILQKAFGMYFVMLKKKRVCGVFELPLLRNTQTRHQKKSRKKGTYLPRLVAIWQIYVAFNNYLLQRPLVGGWVGSRGFFGGRWWVGGNRGFSQLFKMWVS